MSDRVQAKPSVDCMRIRRLLAAYRRDDWSPNDLAALTRHLSICADCRQIEASFRTVGENIRQLPSISPPPAFREAVFEAIRADQRRVAPSVAQLSRASTNPSMRAIRPAQHSIRSRRLNRVGIGPRTMLAAAAVLVFSLLTARILPLLSSSLFGQVASNLGKSGTLNLDNPLHHKSVSYPLDSHYAVATSALATAGWLVYSASDTSRASMLFAENRQTKRSTSLFGTSTQAPLVVRALTDRWAVWSTGDGASSAKWGLYASALSASDGSATVAPVLLVDSKSPSADTPVTLGGVWARGDMVLVSGATARGDGVVLRIALSSGTPVASVIARTALGHLPTNPSSVNGTYYWGDVWFDGKSGLHGAIWRGDDSGHDQQVTADESSFHPIATGGELVWVQVPQASLLNTLNMLNTSPSPSPDADVQMINELNGTVLARDLHTSQQWQIADRADAATLQAGGSLVLWHDTTQTHLYDLTIRQSADIAQQVQSAAFAAATDSAVVWAQSEANALYVSSTR